VRDPVVGAKALSAHLASRPAWADRRNAVDLKRSELEQVRRDMELFGDPADKAAENWVVYYLLRTCVELGNRRDQQIIYDLV
jgi:hypothetical protein